ncbi:MAG: hypothetical protein EOO93_20705, partial [Pedobacter sp.]
MNISLYIEPIKNSAELIQMLLVQEFDITENFAKLLFEKKIKSHIEKLKDSIYLVAETNYIDRVYRDSYYHYYSSKLVAYKRNCIRISLFDSQIEASDFRLEEKREKLQVAYLGFFVLRPIEPHVVGRSIISPNALKTATFQICTTAYHNTVNTVKLSVAAFPHSSQDTETISCAETTLWAMMEYFSNRYAEYKPLLPSKIIQTLNKVTSERQVPSKGLNIQQMSFALREYGFGTRIYSLPQYPDEFDRLISCYAESGIPIIIAMEDFEGIGHALLCIGHETIKEGHIDALKAHKFKPSVLKDKANTKNIVLYDFDSIEKEFIFIDDNQPVYQTALLSKPAAHYNANWHKCKITHFIVPLYTKIYLEAYEAKNFIARFLISGPEPLNNDSEVLLRTYLASSRSFKDVLATNSSFSSDLKDIILELAMPKFIWITEISNKELMKSKKANGVIILDATEANIIFNKPLIIASYQGKVINFEADTKKLEKNDLPLD